MNLKLSKHAKKRLKSRFNLKGLPSINPKVLNLIDEYPHPKRHNKIIKAYGLEVNERNMILITSEEKDVITVLKPEMFYNIKRCRSIRLFLNNTCKLVGITHHKVKRFNYKLAHKLTGIPIKKGKFEYEKENKMVDQIRSFLSLT